MPQMLVVLGSVLALAGLGGIAAGAPSWALGLGLGSTLIQSGTICFVGGLILVGMSLLLRSVQDLSQRIEMLSRSQGSPAGRQLPAPPAQHASDQQMQPAQGRDFPAREPARDPREPMRGRREPPPMPVPHEDDYAPEERRLPPERRAPSPQERRMAPPPPPPPQDDWGRAPVADPYQQGMPPPPRPRQHQDLQPHAPERVMAPAVPTVVRSGIIGGMAYTLYSDGSIEAELPIGTVRFGSIQELQEHVSNTGMDADMQFKEPAR